MLFADVVTLLFFAGFLFRFVNMPAYWKWYSYINFLRYSWGALMKNQFTGDMGDPIWMSKCKQSTCLLFYDDASDALMCESHSEIMHA